MRLAQQPVLIFITAGTQKEAERIADALLTRKKAACVNILTGIKSLFWWQGKIDSAGEVLLAVKSESQFLDAIVKLVKKLHSYDVPEIIAVPIIGGNEEYLEWINDSLKSKTR
jgi:periplasmic divalent cation tolerance protein